MYQESNLKESLINMKSLDFDFYIVGFVSKKLKCQNFHYSEIFFWVGFSSYNVNHSHFSKLALVVRQWGIQPVLHYCPFFLYFLPICVWLCVYKFVYNYYYVHAIMFHVHVIQYDQFSTYMHSLHTCIQCYKAETTERYCPYIAKIPERP